MMNEDEKKVSKLGELGNLIAQYNAGVRDTINADEYPQWMLMYEMLSNADIDDSIFDDFVENPTHYKVADGDVVYNDNWQTEAATKEQERISKLHITKQDFYTYICVPAGITYDTLKAKIAELNMQPQWELCNHVYYGIIQPFLTALPLGKTEAEIIEIFEAHTPEN